MTRHIHIVKVHHLTLSFPTRNDPNPKPVLDDVDFGIRDGEILGLIGNSGCGKTMTSLAIAGLLTHIIGTYKLSIAAGQINGLYKGYVNIPCFFYAVGVFIAIRYFSTHVNNELFWKVINFIGRYTFPMYLMQWFFIDVIEKFTHINTYSMYYRLGAPIPIAAAIILITMGLRKIPVLKHIVP